VLSIAVWVESDLIQKSVSSELLRESNETNLVNRRFVFHVLRNGFQLLQVEIADPDAPAKAQSNIQHLD
jgi:hypothetical protein